MYMDNIESDLCASVFACEIKKYYIFINLHTTYNSYELPHYNRLLYLWLKMKRNNNSPACTRV